MLICRSAFAASRGSGVTVPGFPARNYTQELRDQIVALHRRDGRTFGEIATEPGSSATSVATWVRESEKRDKPGRGDR